MLYLLYFEEMLTGMVMVKTKVFASCLNFNVKYKQWTKNNVGYQHQRIF